MLSYSPRRLNVFEHATRRPFFVVHNLSSDSKHIDWLDKIGYERFYVKLWSGSEIILQAYADLIPGGPQHSRSAVDLSSVEAPVQSISSGICTLSLAHLPGPWPHMATIPTTTRQPSAKQSIRCGSIVYYRPSEIWDPFKPPTTPSPYTPHKLLA